MGVARFGRRQVEVSSTLKARPVILRVCFGTDGETPRYPQVGKTVEGASSERPWYGRGRWLQGHSNKGKRKVASRPYPQYQ